MPRTLVSSSLQPIMIRRRQTLLVFAGCLFGGGNKATTRAFSWQYQQPIANKIQPRRNEQMITSRIHRTCYHTECRRKLLLSIRGGDTVETKRNNNNNSNIRGIIKMAASSLSFSIMFLGVKLFSDAPTFTLNLLSKCGPIYLVRNCDMEE